MKMPLTKLIGGLPHEVKRPLKRVRYFPDEILGWLNPGRPALPPRWLRFDSAGDFEATGEHLLQLCIDYGHLAKNHKVLDAGCGVGRLALPLSRFLSSEGGYEGFDVDRAAIRWCQQHISRNRADFNFTPVHVSNAHYNRLGEREAAEFRFPYEDQAFDFAVATSLFTHLEFTDAAHYLREIGRVLKPGGRALITWYVADIPAEKPDFDFFYSLNAVSATSNPKNPCAAIAFTSDFIRDHCARSSLYLEREPIPGSWRGIDGPTYQDMIVVTRRGDECQGLTSAPTETFRS